jgi:hypothetical protein
MLNHDAWPLIRWPRTHDSVNAANCIVWLNYCKYLSKKGEKRRGKTVPFFSLINLQSYLVHVPIKFYIWSTSTDTVEQRHVRCVIPTQYWHMWFHSITSNFLNYCRCLHVSVSIVSDVRNCVSALENCVHTKSNIMQSVF